MKEKQNLIITLIFVLAFLAISPIAYYYWYALPEIKRNELEFEKDKYNDKLEKERVEQEKIEQEKNSKEVNLESCLYEAEYTSYSSDWINACSALKIQVDTEWDNCRKAKYEWESDEENKNRCIRTTSDYKLDGNWNCLLPSNKSQAIEERVKERKEECYSRYWK